MFIEKLTNNKEWEDFLHYYNAGTFYHSIKWKEVIEKSFSYPALYLTLRSTDGRLFGICPGFILNSIHMKSYHSTPHSDYGGLVTAGDHSKNIYVLFFNLLESYFSDKGIAFAKLRLMGDRFAQSPEPSLCYVDTNIGIMEIDLKTTPSAFIWKKVFSRNCRKKINRIERDFQAYEATTRANLKDFYHLYYKNMKNIGALPYPYQFIEQMWDMLYPDNLRIWLLGKNQIVAGKLFFKYRRKSYAAYVGLDREQRIHDVINYLSWKEVKKAEKEGYECVSLGSTINDPNHKYFIQKSKFGSSFYPQEVVEYPLSSIGRFLLSSKSKAISFWRTSKKFLPNNFRVYLEKKLSRY